MCTFIRNDVTHTPRDLIWFCFLPKTIKKKKGAAFFFQMFMFASKPILCWKKYHWVVSQGCGGLLFTAVKLCLARFHTSLCQITHSCRIICVKVVRVYHLNFRCIYISICFRTDFLSDFHCLVGVIFEETNVIFLNRNYTRGCKNPVKAFPISTALQLLTGIQSVEPNYI